MSPAIKVLGLCFLAFALTEVDALNRHRRHHKEAHAVEAEAEDEAKNVSNDSDRGLLDILLRPPILNRPSRPQLPVVRPPNIYPVPSPLAPTIQLPSVPSAVGSHEFIRPSILKPGIIGSLLLGGGINSHESSASYINLAWVRYALQRCSRIDPSQLTVIIPTTTNMLTVPKMYYFENSTSMAKSWQEAQNWCTARGMDLVTVNDENENKVLKEKIRQIFAGSAVNTIDDGPNAFWIGLNNLDGVAPFSYVGDSTGTRLDWHTGEPTAATDLCGAYSQRTTADNILMDAKPCTGATGTFRYICEVSDECSALFMSRYRSQNTGGIGGK